MKKLIAKFVFFISGWKWNYNKKYHCNKCVMIAAPHTSNWDLFFAMATYWRFGINAKFFIKDVYTKGIHGYFFKQLGAIGVNRKKNNNLVLYAIDLFNQNEKMVLLVPAEGTRKRVEKWKKGFYHIAKGAKVPVALGYLDYKNRISGVGDLIILSDDFKSDMKKIENFYKNIDAKYPDKYNKKIFVD
jgi:1-acyl-sn-glycerol-3-phosphate acyltransferase